MEIKKEIEMAILNYEITSKLFTIKIGGETSTIPLKQITGIIAKKDFLVIYSTTPQLTLTIDGLKEIAELHADLTNALDT